MIVEHYITLNISTSPDSFTNNKLPVTNFESEES